MMVHYTTAYFFACLLGLESRYSYLTVTGQSHRQTSLKMAMLGSDCRRWRTALRIPMVTYTRGRKRVSTYPVKKTNSHDTKNCTANLLRSHAAQNRMRWQTDLLPSAGDLLKDLKEGPPGKFSHTPSSRITNIGY